MAYYETVRRILIIIFVLNISVALVKGAYGLLTNSLSMSADGLHSLFDSTSNIIGLVGISMASRPPDKEHPYGHAKFETLCIYRHCNASLCQLLSIDSMLLQIASLILLLPR